MAKTVVLSAPKAFMDSGVYCAGHLSPKDKKKIGAARLGELVEAGKLVEIDTGRAAALRAERLKAREAMAAAAPAEEQKPKKAKRAKK